MKNIEATTDAFRVQTWKFLCAMANLRVKLLDKFEGSDWRKFIKGELQPHFDDPETQITQGTAKIQNATNAAANPAA